VGEMFESQGSPAVVAEGASIRFSKKFPSFETTVSRGRLVSKF